MSPDLIAFLKSWHDWATNGAPDQHPYWRKFGLCTNCPWGLRDELRTNLHKEFGDWLGPFGGDYYARARAETQHECPVRLAWVRAKLVEAGELVA